MYITNDLEIHTLDKLKVEKFSDAGIQDTSTSISIGFKNEYIDDLTERCESHDEDDDESDKHLEARDRRYSCLN